MAVLIAKQDPLRDWGNMPRSHARILYENLLGASNDTDAEKTLTPNTWERWTSASGTMEARFQPSTSVEMNSVCIAAHNLGSTGSEIVISTAPTVNGTFTARAGATPTDNSPLYFEFDTVDDVEDVKITVTGGTDREIGVVYGGVSLAMLQPIYGGHSPADLNSRTTYRSNDSESGQFLGRDVIRRGSETAFAWRHLDPDWLREYFKPFMLSAVTSPFFIKWRPDLYDAAIFGYTKSDITTSNMGGGHRLMTASMTIKGHVDL
jgi:hypothetical protein